MGDTRFHKSVKNARVNLTFYFLIIFISFFSRRIFLQNLGDEFVGVTSTLYNIIGLINLAELGVGGAVGFMLFKPIFEKDNVRINEIVSVLGYVYRKIGLVIVGIAILLLPFLHFLFKDLSFAPPVLYFAFLSFVFSSVLGYFVNYKQLLLNADQRNYEVTKYSQLANIVRLLVQMAIAYYTRNYYLWIVMELLFAIIYSIILTRRINKIYPFLRANIRDGKRLLKSYPELITKTKQLFVHSMAAVILINLSPVILYAYTSAVMIAHYTNYTIITLKLGQLISHLFSSIDAAVGSVIAEGKREMIRRIFWEISSLYYFIAGVIVITLYFLINPFIILFFGAEYVLPQLTVFIILFNFYLSITRTGNGLFISGYGLFHDTWAPVTEAIINVAVSVVGGIYFGINGVLLGTTISVVLIVHIWKPYFLFKQGFKDRLSHYWLTIAKYIFTGVITFGIIFYLSDLVAFRAEESYFQWFTYACAVFVITSLVLGLLMYVSSSGLRDAVGRIMNNLLKRI